MKLTINTATLQEMLSRSIKGASFDKTLLMSNMIAIECKDNKLTLMTTDGVNYLYVSEHLESEDFYIVVNADVFTKLISKLTCEEVVMEVMDNYLAIKGNGKYKIELEYDSDGSLVVLPSPLNDFEFGDKETISLSAIRTILDVAQSSLYSDSRDVCCYSGYYVGNSVITTDESQICNIDMKLFKEPALISNDTMKLLGLMTTEEIAVYRSNDVFDSMLFDGGDVKVYGTLMTQIDEYPVSNIEDMLADDSFKINCDISKASLLDAVDRLALFVSPYDEGRVELTFLSDCLVMKSVSSNGEESVKYKSETDIDGYKCAVNIDELKSQLKAYCGDVVKIQADNEQDNAVKLIDGSITQLIATYE